MDAAAGPPDEPVGPAEDTVTPPAPGSLGAHPDRHPDDLPPPEPGRRGVPAGVLWALALALVVLLIASWVAFSNDSASAPDPDVVRLDPNATFGAGGLGGVDMTGQPASTTSFTTFAGTSASVTDHAGTPVVLNFWASTCPPCVKEMPAIERVHQDLGGQVAVVGLAVTDPEDAARDLAATTGVTYELGYDPTGALIGEFGGTVLPTTVFIDADGTIVDVTAGELTEDALRARIRTNFGIDGPAQP